MSLVNTRHLLRMVYHKQTGQFEFSIKSHSKKDCLFSTIYAWEYNGDLSGSNYHNPSYEYFMSGHTCFGFVMNPNVIKSHVYLPNFIDDGEFDIEALLDYVKARAVEFNSLSSQNIKLKPTDIAFVRKIVLHYGKWYCRKYKEYLQADDIVIERINRDEEGKAKAGDHGDFLFERPYNWERFDPDIH